MRSESRLAQGVKCAPRSVAGRAGGREGGTRLGSAGLAPFSFFLRLKALSGHFSSLTSRSESGGHLSSHSQMPRRSALDTNINLTSPTSPPDPMSLCLCFGAGGENCPRLTACPTQRRVSIFVRETSYGIAKTGGLWTVPQQNGIQLSFQGADENIRTLHHTFCIQLSIFAGSRRRHPSSARFSLGMTSTSLQPHTLGTRHIRSLDNESLSN